MLASEDPVKSTVHVNVTRKRSAFLRSTIRPNPHIYTGRTCSNVLDLIINVFRTFVPVRFAHSFRISFRQVDGFMAGTLDCQVFPIYLS